MAQLEERAWAREYRFYVTDALRLLIPGGESLVRYVDLFKPPETRTQEEIKGNILGKLRGMQDGNGIVLTGGEADSGQEGI